MIPINSNLEIDERFISLEFTHAAGPGGQNVNKVATAARLRFDLRACDSIPPAIKRRIRQQNPNTISKEGVLILTARNHRTQEKNRKEVMDKLIEIVLKAAIVPKKRKKTVIPRASMLKRLETKKKRSEVKSNRGKLRSPLDRG